MGTDRLRGAAGERRRGVSFDHEQIARVYRVPYWLISNRPKPSWCKRPIWRLRAVLWTRWP